MINKFVTRTMSILLSNLRRDYNLCNYDGNTIYCIGLFQTASDCIGPQLVFPSTRTLIYPRLLIFAIADFCDSDL